MQISPLANKSILLKFSLLHLTYLVQFITAILYALRLSSEWGTDFGIYFVGGRATAQADYGLYSSFFDIKGPTYYGFIRLLSFITPYSMSGAILNLFITALIWFVALNWSASKFIVGRNRRAVIGLTGTSVLIGQGSNASMSLFASAIVITTVALIWSFRANPSTWKLMLSIFFASQSFLVKIDGLSLMLPCLVLYFFRLNYPKVKLAFSILLMFNFFSIFTLFLYSKLLNFSFSDYVYQSILFVRESRWSATDSGLLTALKNFVVRDFFSFSLTFSSGLIFCLILFLAKGIDLRGENFWPIFFIVFGSLNYLFLASDKDYHLFAFYPYAILGLALLINRESNNSQLMISFLVLMMSSILVIANFAVDARCMITRNIECTNPYESLVFPELTIKEKSNVFYLNQGWPYLLNQVFPKVNFTVWWPLAVETKKSSEQVISQANNSLQFPIYVDYNDFLNLQKINPYLTIEFLKGRELIQPQYGVRWAELRPVVIK